MLLRSLIFQVAESEFKPVSSDFRAISPNHSHQVFQQHVPMADCENKFAFIKHLLCDAPNTPGCWIHNKLVPKVSSWSSFYKQDAKAHMTKWHY